MTGPTISSAGLQRAVIRLLLAFSCLLLTCVQAFASEDPVLVTVLQGKNGAIKKDSLRETVDLVYYSPLVSTIANPANDKYTNTVTLYVDENYTVPAQSSFQANLWVTIIYTDINGNQDSINRKEFVVKYDTATGTRYMGRSSFRFDNCRKVKMRIDSVSMNGATWDVTQMLVLENRMSVRRDYAFNCDVIKVSAVTHEVGEASASGNIDELKVQWTLEPGAGITHYDVEWTWVDVEGLDYYKTEGVFDPDKLFTKNATRVTIISALDEYPVPLIYDGDGYLFYRVRPVQQKENGDIVPGIWSTDDNNITWYHYENGHEPALNWQVSTSYAEDGKRKTVIQYFDGTLRGRQTVTKSISRDPVYPNDSVYTIVAESLYDYQGRPTINILPAPTLNKVIEYAHNFNKFTTDVYPKTLYDLVPLEGEKCATYTPGLDSSSGASQYYSSNNLLIAGFIATNHNYIPSAFGYPYTETRYTDDPTGRVAAQGGVGQEYQLNKGHETKYFYGSADQEELDALFGTEVGDASHYFKNMVRDGNGQYSVSYVDMRGRTIATALAGPVPDSLDALNSYKARTYTRNLLANGNNVVKDRSIESSTTLLVTKKGLHTFHYELNPQSAEIVACKPPGEPVCYDCYYDLEIRITSDCMDEPIVITRKNFTFGSYDTACANEPPALVVDEAYELDEGEYNITKILTLSKDAQDWYRKNLFAVNNICKTLEDFYTENYNVLVAAANCNVTCESCITELGSPSDFRTRYLESQGINPANPVAFEMEITAAYGEALAACQALCGAADGTNKLLFLKEMMLQDMMPDEGQYGRLNGSADYGDGNVQYEQNTNKPYNIFNLALPYEGYKNPWRQLSNASALLPFYKNPWNPATGVTYYADEQGQAVVIPDNAESFTQIFREDWAQSLLYLHPEYDKLRYAETNLGTSYDWDVTVENTDTWQAADAAGLISTNILNLDPFFSSLGAAETTRNPDYYGLTYRNMMNTFLTSSYRKTGKTMWQLAWMSVNCKEGDGSCTTNAIPPFTVDEDCPGDWDMVWRIFRNMYLSEKERMLSELIQFKNQDTKRDNILNNPAFHYQRRFVMPDDLLNNGFFTQYNFALNAGGISQATDLADQEMALEYKENCESYISMWTSKLETCPALAAHPQKEEILRKIMAGLVDVCIRGSDADHPMGSSTVKPGADAPTSFEEVIRSVFDDYEIDESVVCTPYAIDYPKPYDKQMPLSNPTVIEQQDSCICARLDALKAEKNQLGFSGTLSEFIAAQHGTLIRQSFLDTLLNGCANGIDACKLYDPPLEIPAILDCSTPLNNCIDCRQYKAAKLQFNTLYPTHAVIYEGDELTDEQLASNKLFEQFMNARTGLSRGWDDYLQFEKDCGAYNDDWNCDELQDVRDAFVLSYGDSTWGGACESAFVTYFNTHFGTTLTFAQIQSLFQQYCGSLPNVCQPTINCAGFENVIDSFYRRYGMPIAIDAQCDSLFADHFNGIYGTDYTYPELAQLYQTTCGGQLDVCRQFDCSRLQDIIDGWTSCRPNVIFAGECDSLWVDYFNNLYGLELEGWQIDSIYRSCGIVLNPCGTTLNCTSLQQLLISYKNMGTAACAGSGLDSLSSTFCNDCFVWYINDRLGTTYVYSEIAALYQKACGRPLTLCQPVDSCGILTKFVQDFNTWLLVNPGAGPCDSLFTVQFNAHFGLSYDYGQIMLLYKRTCGKTVELCNTLPAITCQQLQDIYTKFKGMYPDPSRYFADSCQQAFTYFFNANTGDTLSFPEIQMYYYQLCGMELNICQPDSCGRLSEVILQYNIAFGSYTLPQQLSRDVFVELYNQLFKPLRRVTWSDLERIYGGCGVSLPNFPRDTTYLIDCNRLSPAIRAFYILNKGMVPERCGQLFTRFMNQYFRMSFTGYDQIRQWALDNCDVQLNVCGVEKNALTVHLRPAAAPATSVLPPRLCNTNAVIPSIVEDEGDPCDYLSDMALHLATEQYNKYVQLQYENFDSTYRAKCLSAGALEQFTVTADVAEYHFTLYYYDQAGNLVKTVPPEGVRVSKMDDTEYDNWIALVKSQRALDASEPADNKLLTEYRYNSLNQVVEQTSPDGGTSHFWYDRLGRLVLSRNARQAGNDEYSYTLYDALGRITEVGQLTSATEPDDDITRDPEGLLGWLTAAAASREQITRTYYDLPSESLLSGTPVQLYQANLRNRVSYTTLTDDISDLLYASATYYSYDIHGNVDTLLQHYGKGVLQDIDGHSFKRIEYNYDLISGKVNKVAYQPGVTDQFYHRYVYDAENRLTQVYTSADREHWEKQAGYSYYRHGPLARTELGQLMVQGIDYAYTLQGWLKGVNSNAIGSSFDMGADGLGLSRPTRDAYSFSLQYNAGDYKAVSTNKYPFVKVDLLAPVTDVQPVGRGLYNGNISSMLVNIPKLGDAHLYGYSYDQLNRLTAMNAYTGLNTGNNSFVPSGTTYYRERVSYDGNGNILSYLRNGEGANTSMDNLSYAYNLSGGWLLNNKLRHVTDAVTTTPTGYGDLKNGQASDNYGYDAIGNLVKDQSEGIASGGIEWTVYGKISQITKTNSGVTTVIKYTYDATGNRIGKWVQVGAGTPKQTAYVRDASGNVMAIYEKGNSEVNGGLLSQIEVPLYGSSRLGVWRPDREVETTGWELFDTDPMTGTGGGIAGGWERGRVQFELSNHLGNVLVTISDARTAVDDGTYEVFTICHTCLPGIPCVPCFNEYDKQNSTPDGVVDYYLPQVLTANDYYPFGMGMPGRKFAEDESYRYGFNGKENDNDVKGEGNQQDYGMRIYDPRLGRFLSVDPLTQSYPWYTPYQFAGNMPVWAIDLDGAEPLRYNDWKFGGWETSEGFNKIVGSRSFVKVINFGDIFRDGHNYVAIRDQAVDRKWWYGYYDDEVGSLGNKQKGNWHLNIPGTNRYEPWSPEGWMPDDQEIKQIARDVGVFGKYVEKSVWGTAVFLTTGGIGSSQLFGTSLGGRIAAGITEDLITQGLTTGFDYGNANLTSFGANYFSARFKYGFIAKNLISSFGEFSLNEGLTITQEDFNFSRTLLTSGVGMMLDVGLDKMRVKPEFNMQKYTRFRNLAGKSDYSVQFKNLNLNYRRQFSRHNIANTIGGGVVTGVSGNMISDQLKNEKE